jgi:hypothetical protein
VFDEVGETLVDGFRVDEVIVVQYYNKVLRCCGDIVNQNIKSRFDGDRLGGVEEGQGFLADRRGNLL